MRKITIKNFKLESIFRNVIANLVIAVMISFMAFSSFSFYKNNVIQTSNSEYNGTIYGGDKKSNKLSLMINVYWGNEYVEEFLKILKKYNIKTTFFVGGSWANQNSELLKKIYDDGHEIGNHGYNHKEHGKCSYEKNYDEISKCHTAVKNILKFHRSICQFPQNQLHHGTAPLL